MGVGVDLIDWVGVWLGGTYGCRCGVLCAPMLGVVVCAGLVSLTFSPYPSKLFVLARKLSKPEDGRYRPKYVVLSIANKHHHLAIYL